MSLAVFMPRFISPKSYEVNNLSKLKPIVQEQNEIQVRKKVAFVCAAIFCGLCLLRTKTTLQGISLRLTQAVQYTALVASLIYFAEMAYRLGSKVEIRVALSGQKEVNIKDFSKVGALITEFVLPDVLGDKIKSIRELKYFTSLKKFKLNRYIPYDDVRYLFTSNETKGFRRGIEDLDVCGCIHAFNRSEYDDNFSTKDRDLSWLRNFPALKRLDASDIDDQGEFLDEGLKCLNAEKIESLTLSGGYNGDKERLLPGIEKFKNLKELRLDSTKVTVKTLEKVPENLEKLGLKNFHEEGMSFLKRFKNLKELYLDNTYFQTKEMEYVSKTIITLDMRYSRNLNCLDGIEKFVNLISLNICATKISSKDLEKIPESVESLDIRLCENAKWYRGDAFKRLKRLKEFKATVSDEDFKNLPLSLEKLYLGDNSYVPSYNQLEKFKNLEEIRVCPYSRIPKEYISALEESLKKKLPNIRVIRD